MFTPLAAVSIKSSPPCRPLEVPCPVLCLSYPRQVPTAIYNIDNDDERAQDTMTVNGTTNGVTTNGVHHERSLKPGIFAPIPTFFQAETEDLGELS